MEIDSQVLAELELIRWVLLAIFFALFSGLLFIFVVFALRVKKMNAAALLQHRDVMLAEVSLMEAKGKYDEMVVLSRDVIAAYPNDLMANWYYAIANRKTGNFGAALSALGNIKEVNSVWAKEQVDVFIAEIQDEMQGPKAHDT